MSEHGTNSRYTSKKDPCHCDPCRAAHAAYMRAYNADQRRLATVGRAAEKALRGLK